MEIIGAKWTALILRDFTSGPKRYSELQQSLDINPRTLSQRLDMLVRENVLEQSANYYQLTTKGQDLIPILEHMAAWGDRYADKATLA
jgi:Predicted transcriptional regulators